MEQKCSQDKWRKGRLFLFGHPVPFCALIFGETLTGNQRKKKKEKIVNKRSSNEREFFGCCLRSKIYI
jgi:hypothetical protein